MSDQGAVLKAICDEVLAEPSFKPTPGVTHCNQAARKVASAMGCTDFDDLNLMADDMYIIMASGGKWSKVNGSDATIHALGGGLAFAALSGRDLKEVHGHLAAIYPLGMQCSVSLKKDVPMIANVGRTVGLIKVSGAFPVSLGEPEYYKFS